MGCIITNLVSFLWLIGLQLQLNYLLFMDDVDVSSKVEVIPDHFQASTPAVNSENNSSELSSSDSNTLR